MNNDDLQRLVAIRQELITHFMSLRDYKTNKNALMKEVDYASVLNETIKRIDKILSNHVDFR